MGLLEKLKEGTANRKALLVITVLLLVLVIVVIAVVVTTTGKSEPSYGTPWENPRLVWPHIYDC